MDLDARFHQHVFVYAVQARNFAVLVLEQRRPVEARLAAQRPAVAARDLEILAKMRGVGEQLLRDAADVDAGAAEAAVFGDGDFRAVGGRDTACTDSAGAAAYREKIVIEGQLTSGSPG
jgi:hypothetical protein